MKNYIDECPRLVKLPVDLGWPPGRPWPAARSARWSPGRRIGRSLSLVNHELSLMNHELSIMTYELSLMTYELSLMTYELSLITYDL